MKLIQLIVNIALILVLSLNIWAKHDWFRSTNWWDKFRIYTDALLLVVSAICVVQYFF